MQEELTGQRDLTYSQWHRWTSIARYVGTPDAAKRLTLIDLDACVWIEADCDTKHPLALIETARDTGKFKPGTILCNLARLADIPAFVVLYRVSETARNPFAADYPDIVGFRIRRLYPTLEGAFREYTCREYAVWLQQLRDVQSRKLWRDSGFQWGEIV